METFDELVELARTATPENPLPADYHEKLATSYLMGMESRDETIKAVEKDLVETKKLASDFAIQNLKLIKEKPTATKVDDKVVDKPKTEVEIRRENAANFEKALREYK